MNSWWYVKMKALTTNRDWEGLEAFAKSKKSPIGYEPFVVSSSLASAGSGLIIGSNRITC